MNKIAFVLFLSLGNFGILFSVYGQNQPALPREIVQATKSGSRSGVGIPGPNYWQNRADYTINVQVDPQTGVLTGHELITYFNNSPDTLRQLVIRLYPDFYKKGNARSWPIGPEDLTDGTIINSLLINKLMVDPADTKVVSRSATNMYIQLVEPLLSLDSLSLETSWTFIIPQNQPVRMGKYSENIIFVAYWYPQIAVYDDIDGWDEIDYLGTV